jgi:hypothetical protein
MIKHWLEQNILLKTLGLLLLIFTTSCEKGLLIIDVDSELQFTNKRPPEDCSLCVPAAFTHNGKIEGAYKINNKRFGTYYDEIHIHLKVSLKDNTFVTSKKGFLSDNGFQQLGLLRNNRTYNYSDTEKTIRRALCKNGKKTFIAESKGRVTMNEFIKMLKPICSDAVYLDMGEYGYGWYTKNGRKRVLMKWAFYNKHNQTNWLYVK